MLRLINNKGLLHKYPVRVSTLSASHFCVLGSHSSSLFRFVYSNLFNPCSIRRHNTMSLDCCSTRGSHRHPSTDYEWETLPSIDENALFLNSYRESPLMASADSDRRDKKSVPTESGAVPKRRTKSDAPSIAGVAATPKPSKAQTLIATQPPLPGLKLAMSPTLSLAALQLQKETQKTRIAAPARPASRQPNRLAKFHRVDSQQITRRLKSATEYPSPTALSTHFCTK